MEPQDLENIEEQNITNDDLDDATRSEILKYLLNPTLRKIKIIENKIQEAEQKGETWKVKQLESKMKSLEKKVVWNGRDGTYRKKEN